MPAVVEGARRSLCSVRFSIPPDLCDGLLQIAALTFERRLSRLGAQPDQNLTYALLYAIRFATAHDTNRREAGAVG